MRITNITELIWSDDLEALLRMCGEKESLIGCDASDYQRFVALCKSAHLLHGNALLYRISCFLSSLLQYPAFLCEETAELLWKDSSAVFLTTAVKPSLWESFVAETEEEKNIDICPRRALSDFFDGAPLLNTAQTSWDDWRDEMKALCEKAFEKGLLGVWLTLPNRFVFRSPHPYGVGIALQQKDGEEGSNLLLSQAFRFLSEECLKRDKTILCRVECDGSEAVRLFSYAESQVGLSKLIWSLAPTCDPVDLIAFSGNYHSNAVECALQKHDFSTDQELDLTLKKYADLYPLAKLQIFE